MGDYIGNKGIDMMSVFLHFKETITLLLLTIINLNSRFCLGYYYR